jgi:hypothetical protein
MRNIIALASISFVLASTSALAIAEPSSDIRVYASRTDSAITEGETTLDVEPDVAYAAATDYSRWTVMFPTIRQVVVTRRAGVDAHVTFVHAAGNRDNLHFRNRPADRMVWFEDTGGRAEVWAEIVFGPGDVPGTTRVHSRLYADVHGLASLVVSDRRLRGIREQRVRDDLTHLRSYFAGNLTATR